MADQRAACQGILLVCQCGNRFLVPKQQAGRRVPCTLCGGSLQVPEPRSVQQAAADALAGNGQIRSWKEVVELERTAEASARKRRPQPPDDTEPQPSDPRRRQRIGVLVIAALALPVVACGGAAVYRHWGALGDLARNAHTSTSGGFEVRLPSGLTAKYFSETRGKRPSLTFEGVSFTDGTCVGVAYVDLRDDEPLSELPAGFMKYLEREYHGEVSAVEQCEIRLGVHPGRQITYEYTSGAKRKSYSRWFLVGNRLYDVTWIAGYSEPSIAAVQEFLDSFHLLAEPQSEVTSVPKPTADAFEK